MTGPYLSGRLSAIRVKVSDASGIATTISGLGAIGLHASWPMFLHLLWLNWHVYATFLVGRKGRPMIAAMPLRRQTWESDCQYLWWQH